MRVSRPDGSGFLEGLDASDLVRAAFSDKIDRTLDSGAIAPSEARILRRIGRFQTVRLASRDRNLYQDSETGNFWELKEGAVVRLVGVDETGVIKEAAGSTGYYRSKRMEQNPGTYNDGAGEKGVGKFAEGEEEEDGIEIESVIGMQPDKYYQDKPFNREEGPGHAQTAAQTQQFKEDEWLVDSDTGDEYQVNKNQNPDGSVEVIDEGGNVEKYPRPQDLTPKAPGGAVKTTASLDGIRDAQVAELIDFSLVGLPDAGSEKEIVANLMRGDDLGFLGEMDISSIATATHREEMDRILSASEITRRTARVLRRVGRLEPLGGGMYRDTVTGDMWEGEGELISRACSPKTASPRYRTAAWDVIDSVLARDDGWSPEFRACSDRDVPGIHLENPTADDVVDAIHAARTQGYNRVHVH